jgi:hypothetical protein
MRRVIIIAAILAGIGIAKYLATQSSQKMSGTPFSPPPTATGSAPTGPTLAESRKGFNTKLTQEIHNGSPLDQPPSNLVPPWRELIPGSMTAGKPRL